MLSKIQHRLDKFINSVGAICGSVIFLLMLVTVFYNVIKRYFFNDVSIALQELEWHLFGAMFMFGIGYTLKENAHVRVDIFYNRFSAKTQAIVDIVGAVVFTLPFSILIIYFSYSYTADAYLLNEGSADPGGLPYRWVVRSIIPLSFGFLCICCVRVILSNIQLLQKLKQS